MMWGKRVDGRKRHMLCVCVAASCGKSAYMVMVLIVAGALGQSRMIDTVDIDVSCCPVQENEPTDLQNERSRVFKKKSSNSTACTVHYE